MRSGWDGEAEDVLSLLKLQHPPCAFDLAAALGLECVAVDGFPDAGLVDRKVLYDASARPVRVQGLIFHEVAHHVLRLLGIRDDEASVGRFAAAMQLPKGEFVRALEDVGWHLLALRRRFPKASGELIARRITEIRPAVATVYDHGVLSRQYWSKLAIRDPDVCELASWCARLGMPVIRGFDGAFPFGTRVIVVSVAA